MKQSGTQENYYNEIERETILEVEMLMHDIFGKAINFVKKFISTSSGEHHVNRK